MSVEWQVIKTLSLKGIYHSKDGDYCVYKITLIETGQYYIGMTNNAVKRISTHLSEIIRCIANKKRKPQHYFQKHFACTIEEKYKSANIIDLLDFILDVEILNTLCSEKEARDKEREYLMGSINNSMCLNKSYPSLNPKPFRYWVASYSEILILPPPFSAQYLNTE